MAHEQPKRKWHINQRILLMLLLLIAVVFAGVFLAFNVFLRGYIRSTVDGQLSGLIDSLPKHLAEEGKKEPGQKDDRNMPDLAGQPKNKIGARGELFVVDAEYVVLEYNMATNRDEATKIASYLKENGVALEGAKSVFVKTSEAEYYISSLPDVLRPGAFMVFYVNVSVVNNLVTTVNLSLGIILVLALFFCLFIANSIAKSITTPVKKLSEFSAEIGKGNFARSTFTFQDIEFDELVAEMNQTAEQLEEYDSEQKIFFQNVSHELRTPLMSIRCYAEGVAYGLMDAKESGITIMTETDRLTALVEDLLYISRIDSAASTIEMTENDLRETVSIAASALQPVAHKKGIRMEYQFDDTPVLFSYNENHLYRAILNLISNGIRYAKHTITLRCHQTENRIEVSVIDDGEGISPQELPHIFERFYKGTGGKHGVGLSIVKSVAELHGGKVTVQQHQGTCFTISFVCANKR